MVREIPQRASKYLYGPVPGALSDAFSSLQIPSAVDRYVKEIYRVLSVLETILTGKTWLVAEKFSYADIAFTVWFPVVDWITPDVPALEGWREKYPNVTRWLQAISERPGVAAALKEKEATLAAN